MQLLCRWKEDSTLFCLELFFLSFSTFLEIHIADGDVNST